MKERQEIELTAQRATLQEQRQDIDILDTALSHVPSRTGNIRVEKEHSERVSHVWRTGHIREENRGDFRVDATPTREWLSLIAKASRWEWRNSPKVRFSRVKIYFGEPDDSLF